MTTRTPPVASARQRGQHSSTATLRRFATAAIPQVAMPVWEHVRTAHRQWRYATLTHLARVVCPDSPPPGTSDELAAQTATSALALIHALPRALQLGLSVGLMAYDGSAFPWHRRPARRLPAPQAVLHFQRWTTAPPPLRAVTNAISTPVVQLLVLAYYEQPTVCAALGYDANTYITQQRRRRLGQHRSDIADRARAVLADDPLRPTPVTNLAAVGDSVARGPTRDAHAATEPQ